MKNIVVGWAHGLLLGALAALTAVAYAIVPLDQQLPIHWDFRGEPDRWASAAEALLLPPGLAIAMIVVMLLAARLQSAENAQAGWHVMAAAVTGITGLALVIQIATVLMGLGQEVDMVRLLALAAGVMLIVIGNALPKSRPNSLAGIRVPPSLNDPRNWQATQRVGGYLFVASGAMLVLLAALTGNPTAIIVGLLAAVLVPATVATVYSYRFK